LKNPIFSGAINGDTTGQGIAIAREKTTTTSRTSTPLTDDPHLVIPLSGGAWAIEGWVPYWATTVGTGGFKCSLAFSGTQTQFSFVAEGASVNGSFVGGGVTVTAGGTLLNGTSTIFVGTPTQSDWVRFAGTIVVTVAGSLTFQWAQGTANANPANAGIGAWMKCTKVA
jgi:hypothetical protein